MARVVQQRGTPPYLLILFVFMFLISTTLAVLFYIRYDKRSKAETAAKQELAGRLKELNDLNNTTVPDLIEKMTGRRGAGVPAELAQLAITEAHDSLSLEHAQEYSALGLIPAVRGLDSKVVGNQKEIARLNRAQQDLADTIAKKDGTIKKLGDDLVKATDDHTKALEQAKAGFDQRLAAKDDQQKQALADKDALIQSKDQRITVLAQDNTNLGETIRTRDARIKELQGIIRSLQAPGSKPGELMLAKTDGKIAKVLFDQDICYINLGERDQVVPGLPFAVYSAQTGVPEDGKGKAKVLVINVGLSTSECRIVESSGDDPILEGDLVANVVFDPTRVYKFVVEGDFDLYETGKPDPLAGDRVRALIGSWGGQVSEAVSVSTDFVVMGVRPVEPMKPPDDAPAAVWQAWKDKMTGFDHYNFVRDTATSLQIPVLNTNRFLAFSGHVPERRPTE